MSIEIEIALRELLVEDEAVAGLVGTRVYPLVLPQNPTLPAVVYQEMHSQALAAADGDTGRRESSFQLSYWAASYAGAKAGKAALLALLVGYSGGGIERIDVEWTHDDFALETDWWREIVEIGVLWRSN